MGVYLAVQQSSPKSPYILLIIIQFFFYLLETSTVAGDAGLFQEIRHQISSDRVDFDHINTLSDVSISEGVVAIG